MNNWVKTTVESLDMSKDYLAKKVQKHFDLTYAQALSWVREHREEIDKYAEQTGKSLFQSCKEVLQDHFEEDWVDENESE